MLFCYGSGVGACVQMHAYTCVCACVCAHVCACTCMCASVYGHVCLDLCMTMWPWCVYGVCYVYASVCVYVCVDVSGDVMLLGVGKEVGASTLIGSLQYRLRS